MFYNMVIICLDHILDPFIIYIFHANRAGIVTCSVNSTFLSIKYCMVMDLTVQNFIYSVIVSPITHLDSECCSEWIFKKREGTSLSERTLCNDTQCILIKN